MFPLVEILDFEKNIRVKIESGLFFTSKYQFQQARGMVRGTKDDFTKKLNSNQDNLTNPI